MSAFDDHDDPRQGQSVSVLCVNTFISEASQADDCLIIPQVALSNQANKQLPGLLVCAASAGNIREAVENSFIHPPPHVLPTVSVGVGLRINSLITLINLCETLVN